MLDRELNNAVLHMAWRLCRDFQVSVVAPSTFDELCAHLDSGHPMLVWSGASDHTIFGDARVNWAFRAWHDWHHYHGRLPFTFDGERDACGRQQDDLLRVFGDSPRVREWCRIVRAEVIGQAAYAKAHGGEFPKDQVAFVRAFLVDTSAIFDTF